MEVEERRISIDEVMKADEIFCAGTAAIISPIRSIRYKTISIIFRMVKLVK